MAIFRVQKTQNYTVLSNYHFKEKGMSLKAKGLLSLMLSLPDTWNYTIAGLVKLSKDGKDSVMSALAELETFGYLERKRTTNTKGQFSGIEYYIYEQPNPLAEKQTTDKQKEEKTNTDKPPQLSTNNSLNTNDIKILNNKDTKDIYNINNYLDILDTIPDSQLRNLYCYFFENRIRLGAPLTRNGLQLLIERVREIAGLDIEKQKEVDKFFAEQRARRMNWKRQKSKKERSDDVETC
jgi:hypothetical protein